MTVAAKPGDIRGSRKDDALARFLRSLLDGRHRAELRRTEALPAPAAVAQDRDYIAIVGIGGRFPDGAVRPQELWRVLAGGADTVRPPLYYPSWDLEALYDLYDLDASASARSYIRYSGVREFGISPDEALAMDPWHRLLLETVWQVLDCAGIAPTKLRGSDTRVFVGASYAPALRRLLPDSDSSSMTGAGASMLAGRFAYALDLDGPALTVDTSCSPSLAAMHLAVQALQAGDCPLAIVAGMTETPTLPFEFWGQSDLSQGVDVFVLERLSDACRNGHKVLAVMRGSAVNLHGASNTGFVPDRLPSQQVIRQVDACARLRCFGIDVVEGHGPWLGDPIGADALSPTYDQDHGARLRPGLRQRATGVAGLIEAVLAMRPGKLSRIWHADEASPHADWTADSIRLLTKAPWGMVGIGWLETRRVVLDYPTLLVRRNLAAAAARFGVSPRRPTASRTGLLHAGQGTKRATTSRDRMGQYANASNAGVLSLAEVDSALTALGSVPLSRGTTAAKKSADIRHDKGHGLRKPDTFRAFDSSPVDPVHVVIGRLVGVLISDDEPRADRGRSPMGQLKDSPDDSVTPDSRWPVSDCSSRRIGRIPASCLLCSPGAEASQRLAACAGWTRQCAAKRRRQNTTCRRQDPPTTAASTYAGAMEPFDASRPAALPCPRTARPSRCPEPAGGVRLARRSRQGSLLQQPAASAWDGTATSIA